MNKVLNGTLETLADGPAGDQLQRERPDRDQEGHQSPELAVQQTEPEYRRGTPEAPIPREEYEVGITWLAEHTGLSRKKVRSMLDIVPADWPRLDAAMSALSDYLEDREAPK